MGAVQKVRVLPPVILNEVKNLLLIVVFRRSFTTFRKTKSTF